MRFLFKIYSAYDGFRPSVIGNRMHDGLVHLKWPVYFDDAEKGSEVWVYFHGPHRFENGVYIKGRIQHRDPQTSSVYLRPSSFSTTRPLTKPAISRRVAEAVQTRYRQVFFFPPSLVPAPDCDLNAMATTCSDRQCLDCKRWRHLPIITNRSYHLPERIRSESRLKFRAGIWVIPSRCYRRRVSIPSGIHDTSNLFYRFKVGDEALAFPLAAFINRAMRMDGEIDLDSIDAIIPVPLSPKKARMKELHRTRVLAAELSELTSIPVVEAVALKKSISKRSLVNDEGWTMVRFENYYQSLLQVTTEINNFRSVIIVDDVATRGSTLRCVTRALRRRQLDLEIFALTAGQMILKATCRALP